jgi:glycosyltransferase involved in cell wall biosynthesis
VLFDSVDCISLLHERTLRSGSSVRQRLIAAGELARTRRYEARLVARAQPVVVTSPVDASALESLARTVPSRAGGPPRRVTVVPNGVDLDYFRPSNEPSAPATLVFSGKMSYHANVSAAQHLVRDILPLIRASHPEANLRIAGSNPPPSVAAWDRDPAIHVTGYLPDMRQALAGATIAVCPMTVKVGIQNKILEAMATGLPVVCSQEGLEGLTAVPERDLLVARDGPEFARQVCRLLDDPALRRRLAEAGRRFVEAHHQWRTAGAALECLYRQAAQHRHLALRALRLTAVAS